MRGYEEIAKRLRRSCVQVVNRAGGGSGIVWGARGNIVTNAHVLRGENTQVVVADGRRLAARVIKRDAERDLAVLETGAEDLEPALFGDSDKLRPGQIAIAMGNPLGVPGAVAAGMIHTIAPVGLGPRRNWVQADVRLAPGNSGGMLADAEGRVIGINTMIFHGLALAIPSNEVREFTLGESDRVRLGVDMVPVREGLMVVGIERNGLAERSGMRIGDILRCTPEQLQRLLAGVWPQGCVDIPVMSAGRGRTLRVHAGARAA